MNRKGMGIALQITLLVAIVSIINIVISVSLSFVELRDSYLDAKIIGNTDITYGIIESFKKRADNGEFSVEDAKKRALAVIAPIRFDGNNFVWVMDTDGKMLYGHPWIAEGTDVNNMLDKRGKVPYLKLLIDSAKDPNKQTRISYAGATPEAPDVPVDKIAISKLYPDWNWVLTTAISKSDLLAALANNLKVMIFANVFASILLVFAVQFLFVRRMTNTLTDITGNLENSTVSVSDSAVNLEDSSQKLAEGTTEQAASVQEIVATIEESASMIRKTSESSSHASKLAKQSIEHAVMSCQEMNDLMDSMDKINASSQEISKIIKVIDEIALQTNILSLNAAVEAEKAGEAGKGFAVVAEEVRSLARRSAQSAQDTTKLIENSVSTYREAAKLANKVYDSIQEIERETGQVNELIDEVSSATHEQQIGIEQIYQAIAQVEQVLQVNSKTAEGTSDDSHHLTEQTDVLNNLTDRLISFVKGS